MEKAQHVFSQAAGHEFYSMEYGYDTWRWQIPENNGVVLLGNVCEQIDFVKTIWFDMFRFLPFLALKMTRAKAHFLYVFKKKYSKIDNVKKHIKV